MKCQILFSRKNKENISKCCLLEFLPRVLSAIEPVTTGTDNIWLLVWLANIFAK